MMRSFCFSGTADKEGVTLPSAGKDGIQYHAEDKCLPFLRRGP